MVIQRARALHSQNKHLLGNSGSLILAAIVNAGLGFLHWWLAAQFFEETVVGLASAYVSVIVLLGSVAMVGLGTLLIGIIPRNKDSAPGLIVTASLVITLVGALAAIVFALIATLLTDDFDTLVSTPLNLFVFASGAVLTALTLLADQVVIALMQGRVQLMRNLVAALIKVGLIYVIGRFLIDTTGMRIFSAWVISLAVSSLIPAGYLIRTFGQKLRANWGLVRQLKRGALTHHWLNIALDAPIRLLPVLVTVILSPAVNASFYVAWMLTGLLLFPNQSLTLVLYAVGSENEAALKEKVRLTLRLSLLIGTLSYLAVFVTSNFVLGFFSASYAATSGMALRIISLCLFPMIIEDHFVAVHRVRGLTGRAAKYVTLSAVLKIAFAAVGGLLGGVNGLSVGWVCAVLVMAVTMLPYVWNTAFRVQEPVMVS